MFDSDSTDYLVTWQPTEDAPASMSTGGRLRKITVTLWEGETSFEDIRKIIAVARSGNPDNAQYVRVVKVVQSEAVE